MFEILCQNKITGKRAVALCYHTTIVVYLEAPETYRYKVSTSVGINRMNTSHEEFHSVEKFERNWRKMK